jgi:F-type H+-transporting ATPase subunit a
MRLVNEENRPGRYWPYGVKRWIILALLLLGAYAAWIGPSILKPIPPVVVLPAEPVLPQLEGIFTNTMLATLLADVVLLAIAYSAYRFHKSGKVVPTGVYNFFEFLVEFLWNTVEGATGKLAKRVFPVVATIFLLVFFANLTKLIPGYESIGWLKEAHKPPAYAPVQLLPGLYTIDKGQPVEVEQHSVEEAAEAASAAEGAETAEQAEATGGLCHACEVVPFLRGPATDLNFTIALAVIAVIMTQVYGAGVLGASYFGKFFPFKQLVTGGMFGLINFGVGFLELILEFAKILSFSFRLFGNIFAGTLLLSIVGALLPILIPPGLYLFEIFFGIIQAYVFFLLATMFISMAVVSHGGEHGEEHH